MRGNLKVTSGETDLADKWRTDYYVNDPSCQARRVRGALGATTARLGQQPPGTEVHLVPPLPVWVLLSPPSVG